MPTTDLLSWLDDNADADAIWLAKRLSANDVDSDQSHQAGPYVPKKLLFDLFPELYRPDVKNPRVEIPFELDSHADARTITAIWYNGKVFEGKTRDEARLTGFGGSASPFQDPGLAGALVVLSFRREEGRIVQCSSWLCEHETEEEQIEERIGPVDPGKFVVWETHGGIAPSLFVSRLALAPRADCRLTRAEIPADWLTSFPSGREIAEKSFDMARVAGLNADDRILKRRECEYQIFRSVEEEIETAIIRAGFPDIEAFVRRAQTVLQRRKARSGRSLEIHVRRVFLEEGMVENRDFTHGAESEPDRRPDFLFPSVDAYRDPAFPDAQLRMLGVKTTVRERWGQVAREAARIQEKHLFTLQEGVTEAQYREMRAQGIRLVVPGKLHIKYPAPVRGDLITLETFMAELRTLNP